MILLPVLAAVVACALACSTEKLTRGGVAATHRITSLKLAPNVILDADVYFMLLKAQK